ncbi:MAG: hypothetical protein ACK5B9_15200 [Flavobacteriia bacterium]|jgi:hypothetical protein
MGSKHLSARTYDHRRDFFLQYGEDLVSEAIKKYSRTYSEFYQSSESKYNDFENENFFEFIEFSLRKNIQSDFLIQKDYGLLVNYQLKFFSKEKRAKLLTSNYGFSQYDNFPFYPTGIPVNIRELVNENQYILEEYYKQCIFSHMKQFFIRGKVSKFWIALDTIYRDGFNKHIHRFGNIDFKAIDKEIQNFTENGTYGLLSNADLYTKYNTLQGDIIDVQLLKFNFSGRGHEEPIKTNRLLLNLQLSPIEYLPNQSLLDAYIDAQYEPNNKVRELLALPKIGEGWISETKLYYQLKSHFNNHVVLQHLKPKWLGRQHFDIYFPLLNIAVEFQGKQHFESVDYFGGEQAFKQNIERDRRKKELAKTNNCELFYVEQGYNIIELIESIEKSKNFLQE